MAVINVACPYCGAETGATIPRDAKLKHLKRKYKNVKSSKSTSCGCGECGEKFYLRYTSA